VATSVLPARVVPPVRVLQVGDGSSQKGSGFGVWGCRADPFCHNVTNMARQLRLESEGGIYYVINRGNDRAAIVATDGARQAFLTMLDEVADKLGWRMYA